MENYMPIDKFVEELDDHFLSELHDISNVANEIIDNKTSVADAMALLKTLDENSELAGDIRHAIYSSTNDIVEAFVGLQLDSMDLLDYEHWSMYEGSESDGVVELDEDRDEYYVSMRIKTFTKLYPSFSESDLRDAKKMKIELSQMVEDAVKNIRNK